MESQNHPSSPCCFGSGVAHEDASCPFLRDVEGEGGCLFRYVRKKPLGCLCRACFMSLF